MKNAWEIARNAANKFGGKAVEYIAGSMKQAWAIAKGNQRIKIEVSEGSRKHKSYVAEIVGEHQRFGFDRKFVSEQHENLRIKYAYLEAGRVYEVQDAGDREYVIVKNGEVVKIEKDEVLNFI